MSDEINKATKAEGTPATADGAKSPTDAVATPTSGSDIASDTALPHLMLGKTGIEATLFPGKNFVHLNYDASKGKPSHTSYNAVDPNLWESSRTDPHLSGSVALGKHPGIESLTFSADSMRTLDHIGVAKDAQEIGILAERNVASSSLLGNSSPQPPELGNAPAVGTGTQGGIGLRGTASMSSGSKTLFGAETSTSVDLQLAGSPHSGLLETPTKNAPNVALSFVTSGSAFSGPETEDAKGKYALGGVVFLRHNKPGIELAAAQQWGAEKGVQGVTLNLSTEVIHGALQHMVRGGEEVSYASPDLPVTPYASAYITKASGSDLPDGITPGKKPDFTLGVAKDIDAIRLFAQEHIVPGHSPTVQLGIEVGDQVAGANVKRHARGH